MPINHHHARSSPTMEEGNLPNGSLKEGIGPPGDVIAEIEADKANNGGEAVREGTSKVLSNGHRGVKVMRDRVACEGEEGRLPPDAVWKAEAKPERPGHLDPAGRRVGSSHGGRAVAVGQPQPPSQWAPAASEIRRLEERTPTLTRTARGRIAK